MTRNRRLSQLGSFVGINTTTNTEKVKASPFIWHNLKATKRTINIF
jgi:hypothetical protein